MGDDAVLPLTGLGSIVGIRRLRSAAPLGLATGVTSDKEVTYATTDPAVTECIGLRRRCNSEDNARNAPP
jgi:hypothetical protein